MALPEASSTSQAKNWLFTINNWTDADVDLLSGLVESDNGVTYCVFQKEIAPTSGTPHLQGYVSFEKKKKFGFVKRLIPGHLTVAKGSSKQNHKYCTKADTRAPGTVPYEFGTPPSGQGSRSDQTELRDAIKADPLGYTTERLLDEFPDVMAKYPGYVATCLRTYAPVPEIPDIALTHWEKELLALLDAPPDDRHIYFVVDKRGKAGKTTFAKWVARNRSNVQVMTPAKKADMAYALEPTSRILFCNVTRTIGKTLQYGFFENVKDGMVFSPKYTSGTKMLSPMHVVLLMNEYPDPTAYSEDRYVILEIKEGMFDKLLYEDIDWTSPNLNPPEQRKRKRADNDSDNE